MTNKLAGDGLQLGDSSTVAYNFVLTASAANGTMKWARGVLGGTTQDLMTVDAAGKVSFPQGPGVGNTNQSMIRLNTSNGYGSVNTRIRRFTTLYLSQGTDIIYTDSATLGGSFTIVNAGIYAITHTDQGGGGYVGLSLNTTQPTSNIDLITAADILAINLINSFGTAHWTGYLTAGSIVRAHHNGVNVGGAGTVQFTITRVS